MPVSFIVFASALVALIVFSIIGSKVADPRVKAAANGVGGAAVVVILCVILFLMWQAWSPWDLDLVRR